MRFPEGREGEQDSPVAREEHKMFKPLKFFSITYKGSVHVLTENTNPLLHILTG
jgi:hypothetical protein